MNKGMSYGTSSYSEKVSIYQGSGGGWDLVIIFPIEQKSSASGLWKWKNKI